MEIDRLASPITTCFDNGKLRPSPNFTDVHIQPFLACPAQMRRGFSLDNVYPACLT